LFFSDDRDIKSCQIWARIPFLANNAFIRPNIHKGGLYMRIARSKTPSLSFILKKIADDKALTLFNLIARSKERRHKYLSELNLTAKQYYSRISGLLNAGLIKRQKGEYSLTTLGRVVYDTNMTIGQALTYYWKLKSIESILISTADKGLPVTELSKIIDTLIDNYKIKGILVRELHVPEDKPVTSSSLSTTEQRKEIRIAKVD
jgi:predicted transcriptional regulator with HTH domain